MSKFTKGPLTQMAEDCENDNQSRQYRGTDIRLCNGVEHGNIWLAGWGADDIIDVSEGEAKADEDDPPHATIDDRGQDHTTW